MRYVIDGYNLLYAMGLVHARMGPHGLEKARLALLGRLHASGEAPAVTVVFDAGHAPPRAQAEQDHQGVRVLFALQREADDLIEELIRHDSAPRGLTVVSDDRRVRRAARRRHCAVLGCLDFLDQLSRPALPAAPPDEAPAKPQGVSREEAQHWLREFADLERDPQIRADLNPGLPEDEP